MPSLVMPTAATYFDPNKPNNAQFLNNVYTSGITGAPIRAHR